MLEEKLYKYINSISPKEYTENDELTLSTFIDILSYASCGYRRLLNSKKTDIEEISKYSGLKVKNISYSIGSTLLIKIIFEYGSISISKNVSLNSTNILYEGITSSIARKVLELSGGYISNAMIVLSNTTSNFNLTNSASCKLEELYQNVSAGDIFVTVNPIYSPMIFFGGIEVTDSQIVRNNIDEILGNILVDKTTLIPQLKGLVVEENIAIYK